MNRRNQVLQRMNDPRAHHRPGAPPTSRRQPVAVVPGRRPPNGCIDAAVGGFFCDYVHELPDRHARPDARTQLDTGGLTIQTTLRPGPAALRRPGACSTTCRWATSSPAILDAVAAGHRARAGDEREPPVRLLRPPSCESVNLNVRASRRRRVDLQGVHRRRRAGRGLRRALHDQRAAALHLARSTRRTAASAAPLRASNDDAGYTRDATT